MTDAAIGAPGRIRPTLSTDQKIMRVGLGLALAFLTVALVLPLGSLLLGAFEDQQGGFVWLVNFAAYVTTPSLVLSAWNSVWRRR